MDSQEGKIEMSTDVQTCYDSAMGKKRLIVDLDETEHRALVNSARAADMTVSNYVRKALSLPLLKQGVKRPELPKKAAKKR
jgi:predicted HicB family RNase H-like nuclease